MNRKSMLHCIVALATLIFVFLLAKEIPAYFSYHYLFGLAWSYFFLFLVAVPLFAWWLSKKQKTWPLTFTLFGIGIVLAALYALNLNFASTGPYIFILDSFVAMRWLMVLGIIYTFQSDSIVKKNYRTHRILYRILIGLAVLSFLWSFIPPL